MHTLVQNVYTHPTHHVVLHKGSIGVGTCIVTLLHLRTLLMLVHLRNGCSVCRSRVAEMGCGIPTGGCKGPHMGGRHQASQPPLVIRHALLVPPLPHGLQQGGAKHDKLPTTLCCRCGGCGGCCFCRHTCVL